MISISTILHISKQMGCELFFM